MTLLTPTPSPTPAKTTDSDSVALLKTARLTTQNSQTTNDTRQSVKVQLVVGKVATVPFRLLKCSNLSYDMCDSGVYMAPYCFENFSSFYCGLSDIMAYYYIAQQGRTQGGRGGRGARTSLGVFRRPTEEIRAPVGRRPTLAKITSEANEIHGNPKNHVRRIRAL